MSLTSHIPYIPNPSSLPAGYLGKSGFGSFKTTNYPLYYNGDFSSSRIINAVYNDYAEYFTTKQTYTNGQVVVEDGLFLGICSNTYGVCLGTGNTPIALMGRVNTKVVFNASIGDLVYVNLNTKMVTNIPMGKPIGKIVKVKKEPIVSNVTIILF